MIMSLKNTKRHHYTTEQYLSPSNHSSSTYTTCLWLCIRKPWVLSARLYFLKIENFVVSGVPFHVPPNGSVG